MNRIAHRIFNRRVLFAGLVAALVGTSVTGSGVRPALAHEAKCPVCKLDVPQDMNSQDNEVALRSGRKRIEYRCLQCALSDSKSFQGEITILAPSDIQGKPVLLTRKEGKWSVAPESAVFAGKKVDHPHCLSANRAFTSKAAFEAWTQKHHDMLGDAKPLTLPQMVELSTGA